MFALLAVVLCLRLRSLGFRSVQEGCGQARSVSFCSMCQCTMADVQQNQDEDIFLCAKYATVQLHAKVTELRAKQSSTQLTPSLRTTITRSIANYLQLLQRLHVAVRAFLLELADPHGASVPSDNSQSQLQHHESVPSACEKLCHELGQVAEEVPGLEELEQGEEGGRSEHATALGHVAARVRAQRAAKLQQDVEHMRAAAADMLGRPPAGGQGDRGGLPVGYPRVEGLASVITRLGQREQSLAFHVSLASEVAQCFGRPGLGPAASVTAHNEGPDNHGAVPSYSPDNFAYGSTPYASWLQVIQSAAGAVRAAMSPPGRQYVVWGSSCGWLVAYGALTFGWRSRGVELLACLHATAVECVGQQQQQQEQQQPGANGGGDGSGSGASPLVHFVNGDLLQDDVSSAGVVLVADQCWDAALRAAAAVKLRRELPAGALVVSYTGAVVEGQEGAGAGEGGFEELAVVRVPVSWNAEQVMRVLRKRV